MAFFRLKKVCTPIFALFSLSSPFGLYAADGAFELGTLGGRISIARDVDNAGAVVGESETSDGDTHAFLWLDGSMKDLGVLKGKYSMANGLNNKGQVVGYAALRAGGAAVRTDAVIWEAVTGKISKLPPLKAAAYSQASEINDNEEIVGVSGTHAVVWRKRKAVSLPSLGGNYAIALGINNKGWIIGNSSTKKDETHATLWKDDKPIDLGTLGGRFSNANGINDKGVIVGSSETADGSIHGFMWQDGVMTDIGPGMARAVNIRGSIIGERDSQGSEPEAFLRTPDAAFEALAVGSDGAYSSGFAINDSGIIVGVLSVPDVEGYARFRAMLWNRMD